MNPLKKIKRNAKRKVATTTGIPTTRSGRKRKLKRIVGNSIDNLGKETEDKKDEDPVTTVVLVLIAVIATVVIFVN